MGDALEPYLRLKIPFAVHFAEPTGIDIVPVFRVDKRLLYPPKVDKQFNYIRPGVEWRANGRLQCFCFPGREYVFHYGSIYRSFYSLHGSDIDVKLAAELPSTDLVSALLMDTGFSEFPKGINIAVLGNIDRLPSLLQTSPWLHSGLFSWKVSRIHGKRIAFVGCQHTLWADVSLALMHLLGYAGVTYVIYIGKLGSLDPIDEPNVTLASGGSSLLNGQLIQWNNIFADLRSESLRCGAHITIGSLLEETESWLKGARTQAQFVDPEIGYMARGAAEAGITFSYLHVISDNVARQRRANLSNERRSDVRRQRGYAFAAIDEILSQRLGVL